MRYDFWMMFTIFIIMSLITILIGYVIKKEKLGELVSGYDPRYDNKEELAVLFGNGLILVGKVGLALMILALIFKFFLNEEIVKFIMVSIVILYVVAIILICIRLYYVMNKLRKKNVRESFKS